MYNIYIKINPAVKADNFLFLCRGKPAKVLFLPHINVVWLRLTDTTSTEYFYRNNVLLFESFEPFVPTSILFGHDGVIASFSFSTKGNVF